MSTSTAHGIGRLSDEDLDELWRQERQRIGQLAPEEIERGLAGIEKATRFREKWLALRGGVPFEPGWKELAEIRDERTRQLGG